MQVCVIGIGPLGRRHVEGVINSKKCLELTLLDPSQLALSDCRSILQDQAEAAQVSVEYITKYEDLKQFYDIVIISTTAQHRLLAIKDFFIFSNTKFLLLEKLLFPHAEEYINAENIFTSLNVDVRVNTPRRLMKDYQKVRERIAFGKIKNICVSGNNWGMATSAIHFIDVIQYLCASSPVRTLEYKDFVYHKSNKRTGSYEIYGELTGELESGVTFSISSNNEKTEKISLQVEGEENIYIDEINRKIQIASNDSVEDFQVNFVSELTADLINSLYEENEVVLPTYNESRLQHEKLMAALNRVAPELVKDLT